MTKGETKKRTALFKKTGIDAPLLIVTLVLTVFGLIMMFSASYANAIYMFGDGFYYIRNQIVWAAVGIAIMFIVSFVNYKIYHKAAWPLYIISEILLVITLFMPALNNAKRWIIIGGFQFQPSEITKFAVIILFAHLIATHPSKMKEFKYGYLQPMLILLSIAAIMLQQTHLSGTILIFLVGICMMFVGGTKVRWFGITLGVVVPLGVAFIAISKKMEYAISRFQIWLDPFKDRTGDGHQTIQSLLAIGSGGLMGVGLGNSRQKHLYVPEPQNDFIFSIICEELGFIGAAFVIILFLIFIVRGFAIAMKARDKFSAMVAIGITVQVGLQAFLNIAVVSNTIPNTGISLPFFSQGGTSLVMLLAQVGVLLSISRFSSVNKN